VKYPAAWEEPKRQGCMILLYPGDTALFTSKNMLWVRFWVCSDAERIVVIKPAHVLGFRVEVWERVWDWAEKRVRYVRRVWCAEVEDAPLYPLYFSAFKYENGEAEKAVEELVWNPLRIFEELQAALQMHARLFVP